jgi:hypothetical protein
MRKPCRERAADQRFFTWLPFAPSVILVEIVLEATVEPPVPEAISLSDFLAWESQQAERFEWIDGTVVHLDGVSLDLPQISGRKIGKGLWYIAFRRNALHGR